MIDDMLRKKQLSVNYDKSKYMVLGQKSFKEKVKKDTETNPVKMGGVTLEQSECEKYLGDWIIEKGCEEREIEEMKKRKKEEKAQKRTGCEAESLRGSGRSPRG